MTDRELLEFAAKAAGISVSAVPPWSGYSDKEGFYEMNMDGSRVTSSWNPLNDDGDALRLAVRLKLDIALNPHKNDILIFIGNNSHASISEDLDKDPYAATRRAIVRAAAEIGKTK